MKFEPLYGTTYRKPRARLLTRPARIAITAIPCIPLIYYAIFGYFASMPIIVGSIQGLLCK